MCMQEGLLFRSELTQDAIRAAVLQPSTVAAAAAAAAAAAGSFFELVVQLQRGPDSVGDFQKVKKSKAGTSYLCG
jgi:hypothetical protein